MVLRGPSGRFEGDLRVKLVGFLFQLFFVFYLFCFKVNLMISWKKDHQESHLRRQKVPKLTNLKSTL